MERINDIRQGDIYLVNLGPIQGHEQSGVRPAVVVQFNSLNRIFNTTIIVPLTTNLKNNGLITTHFLEKENTGLKKDSVALLYQVKAIDKRRLIKKIGQISEKDYFEIRFKLIQNIWRA